MNDHRYEYVKCPHCNRYWQWIDFGCAAHWLTCDVNAAFPDALVVYQAARDERAQRAVA